MPADRFVSGWLAAALAVAMVVANCDGPADAPTPSPTGTSSEDVLASRDALGEPMVALAEAVIALGNGLDAARHEVPRGEDMRTQVQRLSRLRQQVRTAAEEARGAAEEAPIESAAAIVVEAAEQAQNAAAAVGAEIGFLDGIAAVDAALLDAAAEWDRPGSQSEIRARLDALAARVGELRGRLRRVRPAPRECALMKRNRAEWISTVRKRTRELQAQANSAGGPTFDRLRNSYRALPLAVEPRTADRADRRCWADASEVAGAAQEMRQAVEALEQELSISP